MAIVRENKDLRLSGKSGEMTIVRERKGDILGKSR